MLLSSFTELFSGRAPISREEGRTGVPVKGFVLDDSNVSCPLDILPVVLAPGSQSHDHTRKMPSSDHEHRYPPLLPVIAVSELQVPQSSKVISSRVVRREKRSMYPKLRIFGYPEVVYGTGWGEPNHSGPKMSTALPIGELGFLVRVDGSGGIKVGFVEQAGDLTV